MANPKQNPVIMTIIDEKGTDFLRPYFVKITSAVPDIKPIINNIQAKVVTHIIMLIYLQLFKKILMQLIEIQIPSN
ncbi:MAG: hypothetical protein ACTSU2_00840 [Promethearchaeota archaeon]